jgi:hypothetical protein
MGYKMKGSAFYGKKVKCGPLKQKNKLFEGEHPDTYIYEGDNNQEKIIDLEDRIGFLNEDKFNQGSLTGVQQAAMDSLQNRLIKIKKPNDK